VLINFELLSDVILPPGVGAVIDWVKPSITVLALDDTTTPDLDLDIVLNTVLRQCGMNPSVPVRATSADSVSDGNEPDKLDPPQWCARIVAILEARAIAIPMAADLFQTYRSTHAKFGRSVALRFYLGKLLRAMSGG
jgi:hypothetical protein